MLNIVAETNEDTVIAHYTPSSKTSDAYQTEAELEYEFIRTFCGQGYTHLKIHNEKELITNLRTQIERLNNYSFTNDEWARFFAEVIANKTEGIAAKTAKIQEDSVHTLTRDNGMSKNITLLDKSNIHNNSLQVINQYTVTTKQGAHQTNRYDVTILVNGLPMVHVELKRRGIAIREAFRQIERYQEDSFWTGSGLYEFVHIFVISNWTDTKYYSNTTRTNAIREFK